MSDEKKKLSTKKSSSKLGHDPLAWIEGGLDAGQSETGMLATDIDAKPQVEALQDSSVQGGAQTVQASAILKLPVYFGIAQSAEVCQEMRSLLASGAIDIRVAGDEVETLDAAAVQLMMAFSKQASDQGVQVSWSGRSAKLEEVSALLSVTL